MSCSGQHASSPNWSSPYDILGTDDYTGSRLSAVLLALVLDLVSTTQGHFPFISVQGQIMDPPWGS